MSDSAKKRVGAVITAAGLSSRMGKFKPLLPFGGTTVISRCVNNMKSVGAEPIVVVTGHNAQMIEEHLAASGCSFVHNPDFAASQMFDSLRVGLREIQEKCDTVLITPVDVPAVGAETIKRLAECDELIARPVYNGKAGHPIAVSASLIAEILAYSGNDGLRGALAELNVPVLDVETDDEGISIDADTPEDYNRILKLEGGRK